MSLSGIFNQLINMHIILRCCKHRHNLNGILSHQRGGPGLPDGIGNCFQSTHFSAHPRLFVTRSIQFYFVS